MSQLPDEPSGEVAGPEPDSDPAPEPSRSSRRARSGAGRRKRRTPPASPGRRLAGLAAALVAAVVLGAWLWSVPTVRTELRQSFTRQQTPYTELYFTAAPSFDGGDVIVPVSLNAHGTGVAQYRLKVTLVSAKGKSLGTRTVKLKPRDGRAVPVVAKVRRKSAAVASVRVALVGHPQSLHFSFVPTATGTPSATTAP
jgi:hypothetical protein